MDGRHPAVVGPARHRISQIDQQGTFGRLDIVPVSLAVEYLETGNAVGPQNGQDPEIGVGPHPRQVTGEMGVPFGQGVVVHLQRFDRMVDHVLEVPRPKTQRIGEGVHENAREFLRCGEIRLNGGREPRRRLGPVVRRVTGLG